MNELKIGGGLKPHKIDGKEFNFGSIFGYPDLKELPANFLVGNPLEIKQQYETDMCLAFTLASVREQQEEVLLSPEYIFKRIKEIEGDWQEWGADPKTGAKAVLNGIIEKLESPYHLEKDTRNYIANPENWNTTYDTLAEKHKTQGYFWIEAAKGLDMFDAIRSALYRFKDEKRAIASGAEWKQSWLSAEKGQIPKIYFDKTGTPHAFAIIGWTEEDELILQLSNGTRIGLQGLFYMPRSVANKELLFALMFADYPENETKETITYKSQIARANWWQKFLWAIIK